MKKIAIATAILMITTISGVFADDTVNDCNLVVDKKYDDSIQMYSVLIGKYQNVIPEKAYKQALIHLKAYCCNQKQILCSKEETDNLPKEKMYPASPYLFDHLIDITMRRLDGIQELAYGLEVDTAGLARRKMITDAANDINGEQAKTIKDAYTAYWTLHKKTTKNLTWVTINYNSQNSENFSLGDKYNSLCKIIKNIYEDIQDNKTIIGGEFENNSFFSTCKKLVENRVERENAYTRIIMIDQSSQVLGKVTEAYTKKYFIEEKLMGLWNLITNVQNTFATIVQQAAVSKSCNQ